MDYTWLHNEEKLRSSTLPNIHNSNAHAVDPLPYTRSRMQ
jgi:hypothetical protein